MFLNLIYFVEPTPKASGRVYTLIALHHNRNTKRLIICILLLSREHHLWCFTQTVSNIKDMIYQPLLPFGVIFRNTYAIAY